MSSIPILPEAGFVRLPQILAVFPVSRSTWWSGVKSGRYPAPIKLSPRCSAWSVESVRQLIGDIDRALVEEFHE
jgi:predicted DNA-binding transcriptional regulator AlpA